MTFKKKHYLSVVVSPLQPVTVPKPFNLGLDRRITERKSYQQGLDKRHKEAERREKTARLEREEEEKKELKAYRKSLNFKVQSVVAGRGVVCQCLFVVVYEIGMGYQVMLMLRYFLQLWEVVENYCEHFLAKSSLICTTATTIELNFLTEKFC